MVNNLFWSVLANLLYGGMTWATAKAYMLANYIPAADQSAVGTIMENNKTGGANIVAAGATAPNLRTDSWYVQGAPYEASLPNTAGILPDISGAAGDVLGTDGVTVSWGAGGGGALSGVGAFDTTPNADGLSVTGTDVSLAAADATHPGGVSAAAQVFGGKKTIGAMDLDPLGMLGFGPSIKFSSGMNFGEALGNTIMYYNAGAAGKVQWNDGIIGNTLEFGVVGGILTLDLSGDNSHVPTTIKVRSADGTVFALTVSNGGALVIT